MRKFLDCGSAFGPEAGGMLSSMMYNIPATWSGSEGQAVELQTIGRREK
jgi:hypothetical protein